MSTRFNTFAFVVLAAFTAASFAACGGNNKNQGAGVGADAFEADGTTCSNKVIKEWQALGDGQQMTPEGMKALRAKVAAFGQKYQGLVCNAKNPNTGKIEKVNADEKVKEELAAIDQIIVQLGGAGMPNGGGNPGAFPPGGNPQ